MRRKISSDTYIIQKNEILDKCLHLTEDIFSSLKNQEDTSELLQERMGVINELEALESSAGEKILKTCPKSEAGQMDEKLKLILQLDRQIGQVIRDTQAEIVDSMKHNTQEQKYTHFETGDVPESGRYLDKKQ